MSELRAILVAIGASDGKMEEGSMRVDANVSVRPVGTEPLGMRCEIKNVNSLRSLGRAIDYEARRQVDVIEAGERVRQETRHWDEEAGRTRAGRSKEEAEDYRYFLEPDLVVLDPSPEWVAAIEAGLPSLPAARRAAPGRRAAGVTPAEVAIHVDRGLDDLALAAIGARRRPRPGAHPRRAQPGRRRRRRRSTRPRSPSWCGSRRDGELTATQAKIVLAEMVDTGGEPGRHRRRPRASRPWTPPPSRPSSTGSSPTTPTTGPSTSSGDDKKRKKLAGSFMGKVMKATQGQADGRAATALLEQRRTRS